jgi:hypothetical protein
METIFGHSMATGRFALGSGNSLGVNQVESQAGQGEGPALHVASDSKTEVLVGSKATEVGEGSKATEVLGCKRKRGTFTEDEVVMLTSMSDAVRDVASALRETGAGHVDPDLYLAVMEATEFSTEALIVAYSYLLENKAVATGFVKMTIFHRGIWLRTYLAKNYFM